MSLVYFWALGFAYLAAAVSAAVAGPRGLRPAAAGIALVLVGSTALGTLPSHLRPSTAVLDVGSSFLLACWILAVALRAPTAWLGGLLLLQGIELALGAACLGPEAELLKAPFAKILNAISVLMIVYLLCAVTVKQISRWVPRSEEESLYPAARQSDPVHRSAKT